MNDSDSNSPIPAKDGEDEQIIQPQSPQTKVKGVLEELEMFALQQSNQSDIDVSKFNDDQKNKLLDILSANEKNAFSFHSKRIDAIKEIEIKKIDASILFFKETFFIPWLTFLTGLIGGVGICKIIPVIYKQPPKDNPINDNSTD